MYCCLCYVQDNDSDENYEEVDPEESEKNYISAETETQSAEEEDNEECYECFDGNFELPMSPHILKPPQTYQNITVCVFVYIEPVHDPPPVERTSKPPNRALPRVKHSPPEPFRPPPSHCKFTYFTILLMTMVIFVGRNTMCQINHPYLKLFCRPEQQPANQVRISTGARSLDNPARASFQN